MKNEIIHSLFTWNNLIKARFRVVKLKEEVESFVPFEDEYISPWYEKYAEFMDAHFKEVLALDLKYDLADYDNVPSMEFQVQIVDKNNKESEWVYFSDPVDDFYNI